MLCSVLLVHVSAIEMLCLLYLVFICSHAVLACARTRATVCIIPLLVQSPVIYVQLPVIRACAVSCSVVQSPACRIV